MPLDRFGNEVRIGWAAHQDEWVRAANDLDNLEYVHAIRDIAELTGRTLAAVEGRAVIMRAEKRRLEEAPPSQKKVMGSFYRRQRAAELSKRHLGKKLGKLSTT